MISGIPSSTMVTMVPPVSILSVPVMPCQVRGLMRSKERHS
jgi:hypothetical protein